MPSRREGVLDHLEAGPAAAGGALTPSAATALTAVMSTSCGM